jgi:lactate permease
MVYTYLALLPITTILLVSTMRGVKEGIYAALLVSIGLFFVWDSAVAAFPAAMIAAAVDTLSILMIVFGALLLHQSMEQLGFIDRFNTTLSRVHKNESFRFYFLAFFLTAFFEAVAGFGTPGAIVPLLLVSLGYAPGVSIVVVLLFNGLFAITGAVGTPVVVGLEHPLRLSGEQVGLVYRYASGMMVVSGSVVLYAVQRIMRQEGLGAHRYGWIFFGIIAVPFVLLSGYLRELTGVVAAAILGLVSYAMLFTNKKLDAIPLLPYGFLLFVLMLPKAIPPLDAWLSTEWRIVDILRTDVEASIKPLRSPMFPFILAAAGAMVLGRQTHIQLKPVFGKTAGVLLLLYPSLAITRLMLASGTDMPSMVDSIALLFSQTGAVYPWLSPYIGALGTFLTGSTTVSNIIFGPLQFSAAQELDLPLEVILAMQLNGASLGNAVCLFNIIAAAAIAGVSDHSSILNRNLGPVLLAAGVTACIGAIMLWLS